MSYSLKDEDSNRLPFPTRKVGTSDNYIEVYIIPENKKTAVLKELYPFEDIPSLHEEMVDLHTGKKFLVKEFLVTREGNMDFLVSPYYFEGGGSVIDWVPAEDYENDDEDDEDDEVDEDFDDNYVDDFTKDFYDDEDD
ncbi:MAG: hypothetical protein PF692_14800 [Kiritimatiellae bacterium]|jgi:hypothetical protein|nr:hypothetical protein [Kiritimatiellia bacterium]